MKITLTRREFLFTSLATAAGTILAGCGGGGGTSSGTNTIDIIARVSGSVEENLNKAGATYHTQSQFGDLLVDDISYQGHRLSGALHFRVNGQLPLGENASIDDTTVQSGDLIRWSHAT